MPIILQLIKVETQLVWLLYNGIYNLKIQKIMDTQSSQTGGDILGKKRMNYQFLMLVRDKKYPEALVLGKKILETEPNNPSVKKFCDFILANNKQLQKMVQQQKQQQQYESVDEDEEAGQEGEQEQQEGQNKQKQGQQSSDQDDEDDKQDQQQEQQEEEEVVQKQKKPKVELRTCTLNQIPHICTRDHGENQKKQKQ